MGERAAKAGAVAATEKHLSRGRTLVKVILALIALALVGGALVTIYLIRRSTRIVVLPAPTGPYAVGRTFYDWVDTLREEPFAPASANSKASPPGTAPTHPAHRELMVWLWYPAVVDANARHAAYLPGAWGQAVERARGLYLWQRPSSVEAHAVARAPLSPAEASYPILIFTPGYGRVPPITPRSSRTWPVTATWSRASPIRTARRWWFSPTGASPRGQRRARSMKVLSRPRPPPPTGS